MITLYGIPNCDTVKRARMALDQADIAYRFHDFRRQGVPAEQARHWLDTLGDSELINRRGTTWRKLSETERDCQDEDGWLALMQAQPSIIKRPVFTRGEEVRIGFAATDAPALLEWLRA